MLRILNSKLYGAFLFKLFGLEQRENPPTVDTPGVKKSTLVFKNNGIQKLLMAHKLSKINYLSIFLCQTYSCKVNYTVNYLDRRSCIILLFGTGRFDRFGDWKGLLLCQPLHVTALYLLNCQKTCYLQKICYLYLHPSVLHGDGGDLTCTVIT